MKATLVTLTVDGNHRSCLWRMSESFSVGGTGGGSYEHIVTRSRDNDGQATNIKVFTATAEGQTRKQVLFTVGDSHSQAVTAFIRWCKR